MKLQWLKKIRLWGRIKTSTKSIRDYINSMAREEPQSLYYEENKRKIIEKIIHLIDLYQQLLSRDGKPPKLNDYEEAMPEDVDLSLSELLVLFRQALAKLQEMPPKVQQNALEILYSYFIELQGLYDLIFVSMYASNADSMSPLSPSSIADHRKRFFRPAGHVADDPVIQEYRSIAYQDLMNFSVYHHLFTLLFELVPQLILSLFKNLFRGRFRLRHKLDPQMVTSPEQLRALLAQHPLSETTKLLVAIHRHTMRVCDILFTRLVLHWGRPVFELLVLATWCQTVKDHIIPGIHRAGWQVEQLEVEQEIIDQNGELGRIKMSSAFFMQPRVKFQLERFLIFKNRTMTVGDVVRTHELGNWMRQNSPDEFLQFFNIALGDMGGLGVRTMPEHEIIESENTQWLYSALMTFIPGGMMSPGSIHMRKSGYSLLKEEQLLMEILYYDPRFVGSSSLITDIKTLLKIFKRRFKLTEQTLKQLEKEGVPSEILTALTSLSGQEFRRKSTFLKAIEDILGRALTHKYKEPLLRYAGSRVLNEGRVGSALKHTESFNGRERGF